MLDCPYLLLITESRAVSIICGYGIPKAAVIHKRGTQRPSSAAASRIFFFAISSRFQRLFSLVERKTYGQLGFCARKPCCKPLFMPLNSDFNPLFRRPIPAHAILSRPLPPVRSARPYSGLHRYSARQRCCWKARREHIPLPHLSYRYKE